MDSQLPLRDIHLPEPNSWWPPAPGWWLLLLLVIVVAAFIWWLRGKYRQRAALRSALSQLKTIQSSYKSDQNSQRLLSALSELVRRVMISHFHREDVSSLVGDVWLERLDQALDSEEFSRGVGSVLARGPYQQQVEFDGVHGGTKFAGAGMHRSDDVHGGTKFAGAGMHRSDEAQLIGLVKRLIKKVLTPDWFGEWSWDWARNLPSTLMLRWRRAK